MIGDAKTERLLVLAAEIDRKPLPFPHKPSTLGNVPACVHAEGGPKNDRFFERECPGCRAALAHWAGVHPDGKFYRSREDEHTTVLEAFRAISEDFDPLRVVVERHLTRTYKGRKADTE